ncbi:hypothetical protein GCM10009585_18760 [Brevibacterium paucivorans]
MRPPHVPAPPVRPGTHLIATATDRQHRGDAQWKTIADEVFGGIAGKHLHVVAPAFPGRGGPGRDWNHEYRRRTYRSVVQSARDCTRKHETQNWAQIATVMFFVVDKNIPHHTLIWSCPIGFDGSVPWHGGDWVGVEASDAGPAQGHCFTTAPAACARNQ